MPVADTGSRPGAGVEKLVRLILFFLTGRISFSLKLKRHTIFQLRHGAFHRVNNNGSVFAAEEYLGTQPKGSLTPMRVDAAFVNGRGEVQILENVIGAF